MSECPKCGDSSYSTHREKLGQNGVMVYHSECSNCGYCPLN